MTMQMRRTNPTAYLTAANLVSFARLVGTPFMLVLIAERRASYITFGLWLVFSVSDMLDGWLARRASGGPTKSGAFLDPLADKFLVLGALFMLLSQRLFWWVPVVIISGRELFFIAYRSLIAQQGVSMPAKRLAKLKTITQDAAVALVLLPPVAHHAPRLGGIVLWIAAVLTIISGVQYFTARRAVVDVEVSDAL